MNSFERIMAVVNGQETDRPPVSLTLSLYGAKLTGCPLREYYRNPNEYVNGQLAVIENISPDIILSPFSLSIEAESFGSELIFLNDNPPNIKKPAISNISDISDFKAPDINSDPSLLYFRESIRSLSPLLKEKGIPFAAPCTSPVDMPALIFGIDLWLELLLFHEKKAMEILEIMCLHFNRWIDAIVEDGINIIVTPVGFCNPKILTEKIILNSIISFLNESYSKVKVPLIFHHGGEEIEQFIPLFNKIPNVAGFFIDPRDSFSNIRKIIPREKLLLGNLRGPTLWALKEEYIYSKCLNTLEERKDDKHFILASSCADIAYNTPVKNIKAIMKAANDFRA